MKKLAPLAALALIAAIVAGPAQAGKQSKPTKAPATCVANNVGFNASGALISATLTKEANGRYGGSLKVNLAKANHHAPTGEQPYPLTGVRIKFHHGVSPTAPAPGSRVKLSGTITELPNKHCTSAGFTPAVTVKKVDIRPAKK